MNPPISSPFIFHTETVPQHQHINIDELYARQRKKDEEQLNLFNIILGRVHNRIRQTVQKTNLQYVYYAVPMFLFGQPLYDKGDCIAYIFNKLTENGFHVEVFKVNCLYVSWSNWVPSHVRNEVRRKHGIQLDPFGNVIAQEDANGEGRPVSSTNPVQKLNEQEEMRRKRQQYPSAKEHIIKSSLVYNPDILEELEKKVHK